MIVNYNVKEYLAQLLQSMSRALEGISHEILVVDNASVDGSVAHIREHFPEVRLIASEENLGFGKANNLALEQVNGEFVVMINPDVVVQEDTFTNLLAFFEETPEAGAATCKIINPDGSFSVDCRHSIPTPAMALWKVLGLAKIFPKSKTFAAYNLTYLDENESYAVPAISGCFMMLRREVLEHTGGFDERFFMYCEDIDLCHRINEAGFNIWYVPTTQIIHYKGESTKKNNVDYVVTFNKALYQFFEKYYAGGSLFIFRWLIVAGIITRGVVIYARNFLRENFPLILDTIILNAMVMGSFILRLSLKDGFLWENYFHQYWVINLISTLIFWGAAYYAEVYPHHRLSIQGIIKANLWTFLLLASLTFFLKQFAFSRMVVLIAAFISPLAMIAWRSLLKRRYQGDGSVWGRDLFSKPTILVGDAGSVATLYRKIREKRDFSYDLLGVVTVNAGDGELEKLQIPVLGDLENLDQLILMHRARQVIFSSELLSYEKILRTMSQMGMPQLEYKIAPSNQEVMIGKSSIERLDDYPLVDVEYAIGKPFNRVSKRVTDVLLALPMWLVLLPLAGPFLLARVRKLAAWEIFDRRGKAMVLWRDPARRLRHPLNLFLLIGAVLRGKLSLVGAPMLGIATGFSPSNYWYQPGLTGLVQINRRKILAPDDLEKYHLFYLKNQSLLLDGEILLKSVFVRQPAS